MVEDIEVGQSAAVEPVRLDDPVILLDPPPRRLPRWVLAVLVLGAFAALVASCDAPGFDPRLVRQGAPVAVS